MTDSTTSSPMILTPNSTGSSSNVSAAVKKARRQTAFYPNTNPANKQQKPFSRSAAKRESVMALGSIEHLQHYFTKTGIAAKKNPLSLKGTSGLVPALGPLNHKSSDSVSSQVAPTSPEMQLPPTPAVSSTPSQPTMAPHIRHYETDPETLLPGVVDDLDAVVRIWKLSSTSASSSQGGGTDPNLLGAPGGGQFFDVLGALKITTQAIRSIRNYVLSLPDESTGTIREQYRSKILTSLNSNQDKSHTSTAVTIINREQHHDPLTLVRKSALELLTVLRVLEENSRLPLSDDAYDAQSDGGHSHASGGAVASPQTHASDLPSSSSDVDSEGLQGRMDPEINVGYSLVHVQGRKEGILVWEDEEDVWNTFNEDDDEEERRKRREAWDERLILGGGWLYKQDIQLMEDLGKEREAVRQYLDVVDEVLFDGSQKGVRGWEREKKKILASSGSKAKSRRASEGGTRSRPLPVPPSSRMSLPMGSMMAGLGITEEPEGTHDIEEQEGIDEQEEDIDEDSLPEWARRTLFTEDNLARIHCLIHEFLPPSLSPYLASPSPPSEFLGSLTSGQLLCVAYNAIVRKSKKPWGFISKEGIHDIVALELASKEGGESGKGGWTFRRIDNLRLWIGALKLRYLLPIQVPPTSSSVTTTVFPSLPYPNQRPITPSVPSSKTSTPLPSPSASRFTQGKIPHGETPIFFDAKVVAKRDEGWEEMLRGVLEKWIEKVVDEKRS